MQAEKILQDITGLPPAEVAPLKLWQAMPVMELQLHSSSTPAAVAPPVVPDRGELGYLHEWDCTLSCPASARGLKTQAPEYHPPLLIAGPDPDCLDQRLPQELSAAINDPTCLPKATSSRSAINRDGGGGVGACGGGGGGGGGGGCGGVEGVDKARMLVLKQHNWRVVETRRSAGGKVAGVQGAAAESFVVVPAGVRG